MPGASSEEIARLEALHADNPRGRVFAHLAEAYRRAGQAARARELLRRGLADHPDYPSAHVVLGRVLEDLGDPEAAERSFARVLDLDPHNMIALRRLAAAADEGGRSEEALAHWTALAGLEPGDEFVEARIAALTAPVDRTGPGPAAASTRPSPAETGEVPARGGRDEQPDHAASAWDPFDEEAAAEPLDAVPVGHDAGAASRERRAEEDGTDDVAIGDVPGEDAAFEDVAVGEVRGEDAFEDVAIGDVPGEDAAFEDVAIGDVPGEDVAFEDVVFGDLSDEDRAPQSLPLMDLDAVELDVPPGAAEAPPTAELGSEHVGAPPVAGETATSWPDLDAGLIDPFDGPGGAGDADWPEADAGDLDLDEDFPGVETETLGDLYAAQGLHGRAAGVYRRLLRRKPADVRLQAKLYEAESRVAGGEAEPVLPEWGDVAGARRPSAPSGPAAGRGPDAVSPSAGDQDAGPRAATRDATDRAEEPPAAEEPRVTAGDEWPALEGPPEEEALPEEPLTFAEPFLYGAGAEVRVGSAWDEPGAVADLADGPDAEVEQDVPGALWTGEEFEGSVFAPGAPAGASGEEVGSASGDSTGGADVPDGAGGARAVSASADAVVAPTEAAAADDAGLAQVAAYDTEAGAASGTGTEDASTFDAGDLGISAFDGEVEAHASAHAQPREGEPDAAEPEPDSLAAALAGALAADRQAASIRDALRGVISWTPGSSTLRPDPPAAPTRTPSDTEPPSEPGSPTAGAGTAARVAPPPPPPPPPAVPPPDPGISPPDPALEPWSLSPSSAERDASLPARAGGVLELGEADLVRPSRHGAHPEGSLSATPRPDGPAEPTLVGPDREESAPRGPGAEAGAKAPETGSGDLGDLARSFLDASVASDEEAAKSADTGDDEEVEVFRSWLRSLKK